VKGPLCNWCAEEADQGMGLTTISKKAHASVDHIICAACGLKAIIKAIGKPKIKPVITLHTKDEPKGTPH
jgi:hypothetical protein